MKFVPTAAEAKAIKRAASLETGIKETMVLLEPAYRCNTTGVAAVKADELNVALISNLPDWSDTDLADYGSWAEFRKGTELTEDGRGIYDFTVRQRFDEDQEMFGWIVVHVENGRLSRIDGYPDAYDSNGNIIKEAA